MPSPGYISLPYDSIVTRYRVKAKTSEETSAGYTNKVVLGPVEDPEQNSSFVGDMLLTNLDKDEFNSIEYDTEIFITISNQFQRVEPVA